MRRLSSGQLVSNHTTIRVSPVASHASVSEESEEYWISLPITTILCTLGGGRGNVDTMAEGGYDPCECIWNHENAMQRLMNLLRNSQSFCTDNECITDLPGPPANAGDGGSSLLMFMMAWLAIAFVLFLVRPSSLRNRGDQKPPSGPGGGPDPPPAPPMN